MQSEAAKGKPSLRTKKLKPIKAMFHPEQGNVETVDNDVRAKLVQGEFEREWAARDLHQRSLLNDAFLCGARQTLVVNEYDLRAADARLRKTCKLNGYGGADALPFSCGRCFTVFQLDQF